MSTPENLQVRLFDRDHNGIKTSSELSFTINRYSKTINGGCKDAFITAYGNENAMWRLANMLRYGLYVYDNKNKLASIPCCIIYKMRSPQGPPRPQHLTIKYPNFHVSLH